MPISCFEPSLDKHDLFSVQECLKSNILGFGPNVEEFEKRFFEFSKSEHNVAVSSASAAAYMLFNYIYDMLGPCNVFTPALGFTSPAWAAQKNGHNLIFVDVDENLLFDIKDYTRKRLQLAKNLKKAPNILMPVLYGGVSNIDSFSEKNNFFGDEVVVVDSAHCITPNINSDYIFFSFHPVKPICMSNGGILSVGSAEEAAYFKAYRNFGRTASEDSYGIDQAGFNFYMNNLNASLGLSQIKKALHSVEKRKQNFLYIKKNLDPSAGRLVDHDEHSSYYLATIIPDKILGSELRNRFLQKNIQATFHYPPLHKTRFFKKTMHLKNTEKYATKITNIPIHQNLTKKQLLKIVKLLNETQ